MSNSTTSFRSLSMDTVDEINHLSNQAKSLIQIVMNNGHDLRSGFLSSQETIINTLCAALDIVSKIDEIISNVR